MITPRHPYILIEPIEVEHKHSNIILAVHSEMSHLVREIFPSSAKVLKIPQGVSIIKEGDIVYYARWSVKHSGEFYFIDYHDILAKRV